jgi:predicted RNA binding protein YcfA (HicA-like mRNA interferase family)
VLSRLRAHDPRFRTLTNRAKGSERMIYHPDINGRPESYPMTFHKGRDIGKGMLKAIIRRFNLPPRIFG